MTLCEHCNTPLRAIGDARKNGKNHSDWADREYHKKCWKDLISMPDRKPPPFDGTKQKVKFGKHKGKTWNAVPKDYAVWLLSQPNFKLADDIKTFLLDKFKLMYA